MQILLSKFIYPKDMSRLKKVLKPFAGKDVQLAFFKRQDWHKFDHPTVKKTLDELKIKVPTLHAPTVDVFHSEFIDVLSEIKMVYGTKLLTIHPQKGDEADALPKLLAYADQIEELGIVLAYENFYPNKRNRTKWVYLPEDLYAWLDLPFLKITYDCSHAIVNKHTLSTFERIMNKAVIVHLSNRNGVAEHLPIGRGVFPVPQFLDLLREKSYKGYVVLEYQPQYEKELFRDEKKVNEYLNTLSPS